jgi:hypothetical protein
MMKNPVFGGDCQQYILDKQAPGTRFDQCLQGFCALKKPSIMEGGLSALCAKICQ